MKIQKSLEKDLMWRFFEELDLSFPKLREDKRMSLKDICSDKFWASLTRSEKSQLGVIFYDLVVSQAFGLKFVAKNKAKGNLYELI